MSNEVPTHSQPKPFRRQVPIWLRVVFFLVMYVYSIGPMFWVWYEAENLSGSPALRAFYAPLKLLCRSSGAFENFLNRYIGWWIT